MLIKNLHLKFSDMNICCCCLQKYVNKLVKRDLLPDVIIGKQAC